MTSWAHLAIGSDTEDEQVAWPRHPLQGGEEGCPRQVLGEAHQSRLRWPTALPTPAGERKREA